MLYLAPQASSPAPCVIAGHVSVPAPLAAVVLLVVLLLFLT